MEEVTAEVNRQADDLNQQARQAIVEGGAGLGDPDLEAALAVDPEEWRRELPLIEELFEFVGEKLPTSLQDELDALKQRLG